MDKEEIALIEEKKLIKEIQKTIDNFIKSSVITDDYSFPMILSALEKCLGAVLAMSVIDEKFEKAIELAQKQIKQAANAFKNQYEKE